MLSLVLVFCLITGVAPSAAAADIIDKSGWINLLDYTTVESGSNFFVVSGTKTITVALPFQTNLFYVDMVLYVNGSGLSSALAYWPNSGSSTNLEIYRLGNGLYRVYGAVPSGNYSSFKFSLTSSGTAYVTCQSLRVRTLARDVFVDVGSISLNNSTASMTDPLKPVNITASSIGTYTGYVQFLNWYKYDSVEYTLGVMTDSLGSIDAYYGNIPVPIDVSYIEIPDQSRMYYIQISVDVSGLDKELGYPLSIRLCGEATSSVAALYLYSICGYVDIVPPSPLVYWFTSLFSKLGSWFDGVENTVSTGFSNLANWLSSGFQSVVNKLDELVTGGSAGDKVSSGGNKIEQSSGSLSDNMDQIQDFENQQFGNLDAGMGTVIAGGDVSYLVAPLGFIHTYTNKIVAAIPSSYLVVFTLPMLFGVFMFIVGHPIRAPGPDTSGDQVTRETFTTTTVLEGKHKGSTTTTRTVTTSQEIGRRHTE